MAPSDFIKLMKTNGIVDKMKFLDSKENIGLYKEAKELLTGKDFGQVEFDFDYDSEPFVFNKYINGKLDRTYKICIFEYGEEKDYTGQTSKVYIDGMPIFYDQQGNIIKNSLN
jgi:hypothetical protein